MTTFLHLGPLDSMSLPTRSCEPASNGGHTLYNDVWGSGAGPQTIWANSYRNWGVWSNQPDTGGINSYPNVTK